MVSFLSTTILLFVSSSFVSILWFWHQPPTSISTSTASSFASMAPPCLPKRKRTFLIIGQDLFSIQDYINEQYNYTLHQYMEQKKKEESETGIGTNSVLSPPTIDSVLPNGFMVYTDIQTLRGLYEPIDYGTGIEYADGVLSMISSNYHDDTTMKDPGSHQIIIDSMQIGLWLNGTTGCNDIVNGILDQQIQTLFYYCIRQYRVRIIYLRIGYEFDNPDFGYSANPALYQSAYRYIVNYCMKQYPTQCSQKLNFVWHSWAAGGFSSSYYPGNDYVHYVGISIFQQFYPNSTFGTMDNVHDVINFAQEHNKPIMIAESTPFGGIHHSRKDDLLPIGHDPWEHWFIPILQLIVKYKIGIWSYINCNWDQQPMWSKSGFGDTRIHSNQTIMKLWSDHIIRNKNFTLTTKEHTCNYYPIDNEKKNTKKKKTKTMKKHDISNINDSTTDNDMESDGDVSNEAFVPRMDEENSKASSSLSSLVLPSSVTLSSQRFTNNRLSNMLSRDMVSWKENGENSMIPMSSWKMLVAIITIMAISLIAWTKSKSKYSRKKQSQQEEMMKLRYEKEIMIVQDEPSTLCHSYGSI